MSNKSNQGVQTSLPVLGMNKSSSKTKLNQGEYIHARNAFPINTSGNFGEIQNAPSNILCTDLDGKTLLGSVYLKERNEHILFLRDSNSISSIEILKDCVLTPKIEAFCLNFNLNYPIKSVYRIDLNGDIIVYFQDGFNPDRKINIDNPPKIKGIECNSDTDILDCSAINIINDSDIPIVELENVSSTGALQSGGYRFKIAYADATGNELSSYFSLTDTIPIYKDSMQNMVNTEGSPSATMTGKSITVAFKNIDTKYNYIALAIIKVIGDGVTYSKILIPSNIGKYTFTGREVTLPLSLDLINAQLPTYLKSKTLTTANNYLIRANVEDTADVNLQWLANRIKLNWLTIELEGDNILQSYKNPLIQSKFKGYMRGEVYAFGIQFIMKNNIKTRVFSLLGRKPQPSDLTTISTSCDSFIQNINECNPYVQEVPRWIARDTSYKYPRVDFGSIDCDYKIIDKGEFAYWESTDVYPCDSFYEENAGQPIRHFKFPSNETTHIHDGSTSIPLNTDVNNKTLFNKTNKIYPIGIELRDTVENYIISLKSELSNSNSSIHNYITPEETLILLEELDNIKGYEIVRSDRIGNSSVIAKGLLFNAREYTLSAEGASTQKMLYPNYPYNPISKDPYININNDNFTSYTYTLSPVINGDDTTVPIPVDPLVTYDKLNPGVFYWLDPSNPEYNSFLGTVVSISLDNNQANETIYNWDNYVSVSHNVTRYHLTDPSEVIFYKIETIFEFIISEGDNDDYDTFKFTSYYYETSNVDDSNRDSYINLYDSMYSNTVNSLKHSFTFHSPETHFNNPIIGNELRTHTIEYGGVEGYFSNVENHPELKPHVRGSADFMNHAAQYKSVSNYSNYYTDENVVKRMSIENALYLGNNSVQQVDDQYRFNNKFRESSLYIKVPEFCGPDYPKDVDENLEDNTLFTLKTKGVFNNAILYNSNNKKKLRGISVNSDYKVYSRPSSYYASINVRIPNQYGQLYSVSYLSTGKTISLGKEDEKIFFGGDIFINRMTLKRKHAFFTQNYIGSESNGMNYKDFSNIPHTKYYAKNTSTRLRKANVIDEASSLEGTSNITYRAGLFYLFNFGVLNFFAESTVNVDLRHSGIDASEAFYPTLKTTSLDKWMEEQHVPIALDNFYYYDRSYTSLPREDIKLPLNLTFGEGSKYYPKRIIYSKQTDSLSISDGWIINLANDRYDSDDVLGDIVDIHALDTYRVMVRYRNGLQIFNAYDTLQLKETIVTVGTGGMFQQRPQSFNQSEIGYSGTNSKFAINTTQFGTFIVDDGLSKVFKFTSTLEEISRNKMDVWFEDNTSLQFRGFFENVKHKSNAEKYNFDNPYTGVGFLSVYDYKNDLWFLTKKDYIAPNDFDYDKVSFDINGNLLYENTPFNYNILIDVGWTISYNSMTQYWFSFHDFKPNFYLTGKNEFFSGSAAIYKHWDPSLVQTYYGQYYPFEITSITTDFQTRVLHTIEYLLKTSRFENSFTNTGLHRDVNFSHVYVNTETQTSGLMEIIPQDKTNLSSLLSHTVKSGYNVKTQGVKIEGNKFRLGGFRDITDIRYSPVVYQKGDLRTPINYNSNRLNNLSLGDQKLRNEWFEVTLIADNVNYNNYYFNFGLLMTKTLNSYR